MMKVCFTTVLFYASLLCFAQKNDESYSPPQYKNTNCRSSFVKVKLNGDNAASTIEKYISSTFENMQDRRCALKFNYVNESPGGLHYSFTQMFEGIPVFQSEIKVNTDRKGYIHSIFDNSYDTRSWRLTASGTNENAVIAIDPNTNEPVIAQRSVIDHKLETLTSSGTVIYQSDINCYFQDSIVSGKVFNPDPLTTAGQTYDKNGTYNNNNGGDAAWLDSQEQIVNFVARFDSGVFHLENQFVRLTNYDTVAPEVPVVTSAIPQFNFNRSQSGFQDVNAYYHITHYHDYIHNLGFNCADSLIDVDTHALLADNSFFAPDNTPHRLYFGIGGVPDAEDADVVVHEYGHSISFTAAPGSNVGLERRSLDEAFGDYNAASYSRSLNTFNDQWVYNWDGHNEYWSGRIMNSHGTYPDSVNTSIYHNGQIWSAVLFSLNGDIGRGATDSLILQAHYSFAQNMSMGDAAILLLDADTILNNGAYACPILNRLLEHTFISHDAAAARCATVGIETHNNNAFAFYQNGNSFILQSDEPGKMRIQILGITGQQVVPVIEENHSIYSYQNPNLPSGIYLVNVLSDNSSGTFKWIKAK